MKTFTINGESSWYTNPETNNRKVGTFLTKKVQAYYHDDYHGGDQELRDTAGTVENIITTLKNQFNNTSVNVLGHAGNNMRTILNKDLPQILRSTGLEELVVCAIPRSKAENTYTNVQQLFKKAIKDSVEDLDKFIDGTDYIVRHIWINQVMVVKEIYHIQELQKILVLFPIRLEEKIYCLLMIYIQQA